MLTDPRSPFFQLAADLSRKAHDAAMQQAPTAVVAGNTATPRKATEHEYARAEASAAIVKLARVWPGYLGTVAEGSASYTRLARVWPGYLGTVAEGSASYTRDANCLSDAVAHYETLCAKDES